jgi:hypothetical protein
VRERIAPRIELVRAAVVVAAVLLAGLAAWHLPGKFRSWWDEARSARQVARVDRQLYAARVVGVQHPEFVLAAARAIPPTANYAIILGANAIAAVPDYRTAVPFAVYWLFPRRVVSAAGHGDWILAFGATPAELPRDLADERTVLPGILVARHR